MEDRPTTVTGRIVSYHVATTVDGFIAHADHTIDGFVPDGPHVTEYLDSLRRDYDVVVMGRRTYEFGLRMGVSNPYPWLRQYVVSRTMTASPDPAVELVGGDVCSFVRDLRREPGRGIYLCGGAELASALFAEGLVDEVILKVNPVLFGDGIQLLARRIAPTRLDLMRSTVYENCVLLLRYRVVR